MDRLDVYFKALKKWGLEAQVLMLAEEASELSVAALHFRRGRSLHELAEEIADVKIMIEQVVIAIEDFGDLVAVVTEEKINRLKERLGS